MPALRFLKTFEHTQKIKIGKSLKRVDSDRYFGVLDFTTIFTTVHTFCSTLPKKNYVQYVLLSLQITFYIKCT